MKTISKKMYQTDIAPRLKQELGLGNVNEVPRVLKVSLNVGLSKGLKDSRFIDAVEGTLTRITGQKPVKTKAKKSIAAFKIRQGMDIGMVVTLRGSRMWSFLNKLTNIAFPRVRDFRGIPESAVDKHGNFSYGFREQLAFPEVAPDEAEVSHGLQVNITTTATTHEQGVKLFQELGFPFIAKGSKK